MKIQLTNIGKRYNSEWIFRKVDHAFTADNNYVILGANGSGKSTLLQVIAGNLIPSEGEINYQVTNYKLQVEQPVTCNLQLETDEVYQHLSFASPYLELFEEFTLTESIELQAKFKPFYEGLDTRTIVELTELGKAKDKQLKYYSSGMKQRVRLALAILCDTPLLLLDEPASNLDKKAIDWYQKLMEQYSKNRLIIVASNQQEHEYPFCNKQLSVEHYKQ